MMLCFTSLGANETKFQASTLSEKQKLIVFDWLIGNTIPSGSLRTDAPESDYLKTDDGDYLKTE